MPANIKLSLREQKLLEYAMAIAAEQVDDKMLDFLAEQEMRICMLELGI